MRVKLGELSAKIESEIEKGQNSVNANKHSANLIAGDLIGGYSIAGDVEHSRNSARLSEERLQKLLKLKEELDKAFGEAPETAEPVCFVTIKTENRPKSFYFVKNAVYLAGFNLISPDAPLGKSLIGKKAGETCLLGKISSIE